jgi:hypothetical protein
MFSYELAHIETANNPVKSLRQWRDTTNAQDAAALRTVYDYESFERDVLRDIPGDHLIRLLQRAHLVDRYATYVGARLDGGLVLYKPRHLGSASGTSTSHPTKKAAS